jgi:hypothetical protein
MIFRRKRRASEPDPSQRFATLSNYRHSSRTRTILARLVCVICPPDAQRLNLVSPIVDHTELSLRALPTLARIGLIIALRIYDWGAFFSRGSFGKRSCSLSATQADTYFGKWWRHRLGFIRELTKGMKSVICMSYCEMPEIKESLGFHSGRWMEDTKQKRLTVHSDIVERHRESLITPDPLPSGWVFGESTVSESVKTDQASHSGPPATSAVERSLQP